MDDWGVHDFGNLHFMKHWGLRKPCFKRPLENEEFSWSTINQPRSPELAAFERAKIAWEDTIEWNKSFELQDGSQSSEVLSFRKLKIRNSERECDCSWMKASPSFIKALPGIGKMIHGSGRPGRMGRWTHEHRQWVYRISMNGPACSSNQLVSQAGFHSSSPGVSMKELTSR